MPDSVELDSTSINENDRPSSSQLVVLFTSKPSGNGEIEKIPVLRAHSSAPALLSTRSTTATIPSRSPSTSSLSQNIPYPHQSPLYARFSISGPRTIRLYDLQASADPDDRIIRGQFRVVNLEESPSFNALSYCWGSYSSPKDTISCGNYSVEVTTNCWSALWHLRRKFGAITIWVDTICINQDDGQEKNSQIPLMRDIYSSAEVVYLWLGEGNKRTDQAMDYLAKGGLPFRLGIAEMTHDEIPTGYTMSWRFFWHIYGRIVTARNRPHFYGLRDIFSRPWIERLWTLQEVLLARKLVLVCGDKTVSWQGLIYSLELIQFFSNKPRFIKFPSEYQRWWRLWTFRSELYQRPKRDDGQIPLEDSCSDPSDSEIQLHNHFIHRSWQLFTGLFGFHMALLFLLIVVTPPYILLIIKGTKGDPNSYGSSFIVIPILICVLFVPALTFLNTMSDYLETDMVPLSMEEAVLMQIQERKVTDSRDRYYAIRGLISQENRLETMPDYSLDIGPTYQRLFLELLQWMKSLDILLYTSCLKFPGQPSWVIDWRSTGDKWVIIRYFESSVNLVRQLVARVGTFQRVKGATPGSESVWSVRAHGEQLVVHGFTIGHVSWRSNLLPTDGETPSSEELLPSSEQLLQSLINFRVAIGDMELLRLDEIMDQLCNMTSLYSPAEARATTARRKWSRILHQSIGKSPESALEQLQRLSWNVLFWSPFDYHIELLRYMKSNKRVLVRCSGDYSGFGITCSCVQSGDIVALISGLSMPMVLRRQGNHFRVVGPAFLGGVMNGELWKDDKSKSLEELILV